MTVDDETWRVAKLARCHGAPVHAITDAINEGAEHNVSCERVLRATAPPPEPRDGLTLEEFAEERAAEGRTIAVWVEGDPFARVSGRSTAILVAYLLTDEESRIVEPQESDVTIDRGDTLLLTFDAGLEGIEQIRNLFDLRVNESNVVVHAPEVPAWAQRLLDVHVATHGIDDPVEVTRYEHHSFEDKTYEMRMAGLVEDPHE